MSLAQHVADYETHGCRRVDRSLGIQKMPEGYALMLDADELYFFWLKHDGTEGAVHWNKWAVWKGAKKNQLLFPGAGNPALMVAQFH